MFTYVIPRLIMKNRSSDLATKGYDMPTNSEHSAVGMILLRFLKSMTVYVLAQL